MAKFLFYDDMLINVLLEKEKPSGGAAVQTYAWMRGLIETGHEVSVLTNLTGKEKIKEDNEHLRLIPLYNPNKGIKYIRWIYYRIPYLYKKLRDSKPDYLIQGIPDWSSALLAVLCYLLGVKFILRVSCDHLIDKRVFQFYSRPHILLMNFGFMLSRYIISQNNYQLQIIREKFPKKKIIKFYNPFYNKPININVKSEDRKYIAWVGLFQYQKNLGLLLDIARKMPSLKFKVAGENNFVDIDYETKSILEKLRLLKNVEFLGYLNREELIEFLKNALYLLNTSHYEGFSNTFLESMVCGTPILATENANPDNIVREHKLGIIYKNSEDLRIKLLNVKLNQYETMTSNCVNYMRENHDYKSLAERLFSYLNYN